MKKVSYAPQSIAMSELENQQSLKVDAPNKIISIKKAINEYNNFYNTRIVNDPSDNTRSVWFDFEMLESYLERVEKVTKAKDIEITKLAFLLGSDENNKRTVFIAPMTFDEKYGINRAFSIDNNEVTFIHRFPLEKYSDINNLKNFQNANQSLLLGSDGFLSSAKAITLYNNYYDTKIKSISNIVEADTRLMYYDKGVFGQYIDYMKEQAVTSYLEITGIHMVFSAYDDDKSMGAYANHQNLFFLPTTLIDDKEIAFTSFVNSSKSEFDLSAKTLAMVHKELLSSLFNRTQGVPPYGDGSQWD